MVKYSSAMGLWPVIGRELRAAARHGSTYSFRVATVGLVLLACFLHPSTRLWAPGMGGEILSSVHTALTLALWLLVPVLAADCISRERREGTLPLLFLTPLQPREIVVAKGFAHGLRALTLWLAVVPVLTIPFISGGVAWQQVVLSLLISFSSICLAMAAALLASSISRYGGRALVLSTALAILFLFGMAWVLPRIVSLRMPILPAWGIQPAPQLDQGFDLILNWRNSWQHWLTGPGGRFISAYVVLALGSVAWLLLAIRLAAGAVKQIWRETPLPPALVRLQDRMTQPRYFQSVLRRWLGWQLNRNPVGWLEQRSWSGRLVLWSWFAVVTCIYSSVFANADLYRNAFHSVQVGVANLLAATLALSAAGSFRRERDSGVMELLLVAPLSAWQIIGGRVRGLWIQYFPAVLLLLTMWLYGGSFLSNQPEFGSALAYAVTFVTLPVVGLYFSLTRKSFLPAVVATIGLGLILPSMLEAWVLTGFGPNQNRYSEINILGLAVRMACQIALALVLTVRLYVALERRNFVTATH